MAIAECFAGNQSCRLLPACALKSAFSEARKSFLTTLDGYRLSDLLRVREPAPKAAVARLSDGMARNLKKLAKRAR
jgi:DNA-binding IscR family transcriptional regulator